MLRIVPLGPLAVAMITIRPVQMALILAIVGVAGTGTGKSLMSWAGAARTCAGTALLVPMRRMKGVIAGHRGLS